MSKESNLDRLAQLPEEDLDTIIQVVEDTVVFGSGYLQRLNSGRLIRQNPEFVVLRYTRGRGW